MNVKELIIQLLHQSLEADVVFDTEDGIKNNYVPVESVLPKENNFGKFVVISSRK